MPIRTFTIAAIAAVAVTALSPAVSNADPAPAGMTHAELLAARDCYRSHATTPECTVLVGRAEVLIAEADRLAAAVAAAQTRTRTTNAQEN